MSAPLSPEIKTKGTIFFNKAVNRLQYLYSRWLDEREYEDFADYIEAARKLCEGYGAEFIRLGKRPFRMDYKIGDRQLFIKITSREAAWFRV